MKTFLIDLYLPKDLQQELEKITPTQRKIVDTLINEGIVLSYSLSEKKNRVFIVLNQPDEEEVMITVQRFPIYKYIIDYEIFELNSHETISSEMPQVYLN